MIIASGHLEYRTQNQFVIHVTEFISGGEDDPEILVYMDNFFQVVWRVHRAHSKIISIQFANT